ncbi:hypothetical protein ACE1SV_60060 [Streptomyces sp. E-15]
MPHPAGDRHAMPYTDPNRSAPTAAGGHVSARHRQTLGYIDELAASRGCGTDGRHGRAAGRGQAGGGVRGGRTPGRRGADTEASAVRVSQYRQ